MVSVSPAHFATPKTKANGRATAARAAPDLAFFKKHFPLTVANFATLTEREMWLRRIWELDERWRAAMEGASGRAAAPEAIVRAAPPANLQIEAEFEIIYAGGVLGLLHAGVMASRFKRCVMVFDAHTVGKTHRDWNISDDELKEFERAGLFTKDEIERAVVNRYRAGFVKFHDGASRLKTPPLWVRGVLDVAVEADKLLALAAKKVREAKGCALIDNQKFVRAYIEPHRVTIETEDRRGARHLYAARLFVDAMGTNSPAARQLNENRAVTHVCPTVGTIARGFARTNVQGEKIEEPDAVDFSVGEILVSTEDAQNNRQLIWEGFAGSPQRDEYTTYLFFYDRVDSPAEKSLLPLFENYFESLPKYKRASGQWRVVKPVFGYIPSYHAQGFRRRTRKRTATERALLIGDAASLSSPLTFCGFGSHVRNLRRLTKLTDLALKADLLDENSLAEISAYEPRVAQMASLAEFMRPAAKSQPQAVNETMNAVAAALHGLNEDVRREMFQDRMTFNALKSLLTATAKIYPRIFQRVREHLGARGALYWLADIAEAFRHERCAAALSEQIGERDSDERETTTEEAVREFARLARGFK